MGPCAPQRISAKAGKRLLDALEDAGIAIDAACGGFAACNTCRVRVVSGQLSPLEEVEVPFLEAPGQRLSCQAWLDGGDVAIVLEPGA